MRQEDAHEFVVLLLNQLAQEMVDRAACSTQEIMETTVIHRIFSSTLKTKGKSFFSSIPHINFIYFYLLKNHIPSVVAHSLSLNSSKMFCVWHSEHK